MKNEKIENTAYFVGRLLKPLALILAPIVVSQKIRNEIADPKNIDESLDLCKRVKTHTQSFMECRVHALPDYLVHKVREYNEWRDKRKKNR